MTTSIRTRWAAIGAAVAVTLGAGGVGISQATTDSADGAVSAFFPIEPCRLADTRPAPDTVGPRPTPLGAGEVETFSGWGTAGNCTLPSGTSGLSLNVTAVGATSQTNLRFFPADSDVPTAANLNPAPGASPTPNAVTVALEGSGEFSVFNAFGSVAVIIDVVGYYDDHTHDDRYYTEAEVDALIAEQAALANPGSILLTPADLRGSGLWSASSIGVRRSAGLSTCAVAAVSIPAGRTIASFDIRYVSGAIPVEVRLRQDEFEEGFIDSYELVTTGLQTLDGVGANEFYYALDNLPVVGAGTVLADRQHLLEICSAAAIEVNAVQINFAD